MNRLRPAPPLLAIALLALAPAPPGTAAAQTPTPPGDTLSTATAQDAYLDETARRLVLGVKAVRDTARPGIDSYTALIRERIGAEAPAYRRDRPYVHGERVARVRWSHAEPEVVHVLGSRFRHPGLGPGDPSEFFLGTRPERFAADPLGDPFLYGLMTLGADRDEAVTGVRSPLAPDSERHYQFRSGDTISLQLPEGRTIEAVAVTVIPRVRSIRLLSAIMWVEPESMALVRVAHRLAKKVDREVSWQLRQGGRWAIGFRVDVGAESADVGAESPTTAPDSAPPRNTLFDRFVNGLVSSTMPPWELDITTVLADYSIVEQRHWLPRLVRWEGYVGADEDPGATGLPAPVLPMAIDWTIEIEDVVERGEAPARDAPATAAEAIERWRELGDSVSGVDAPGDTGEVVTITPADRSALTRSELLPPNVWEEDITGLDDEAVAAIASTLAGIGVGEGGDPDEAANPWTFFPPGKTFWLLRYNPVEGLSAGTRLRRDFTWGRAAATVRIPTRRAQVPDVDVTFARYGAHRRLQLSFYRSLRGGGVDDPDFGTSSSIGGIVTAADSTAFHWSRGVSLRVLPGRGERYHTSLRLFAESDVDVPGGGVGGPGAEAGSDEARNRVGASLGWRPWWGGATRRSAGGGGWAGIRGALGDNPHVRAGISAGLVVPLGGGYRAGLEAGAARVWGDPAPGDLWSVGGSGNWLRGHSDHVLSDALWRTRVDVQRPLSFLQLSVFYDWARTGARDLHAVGAGLVFMDGIMRLDLAQGLPRGGAGPPAAALRLHFLGDMLF